jgi:hypothetical protein
VRRAQELFLICHSALGVPVFSECSRSFPPSNLMRSLTDAMNTTAGPVFHFSKTSTTPDRLTRSPLLAQCFTLRGNFFGEIPGMPETNRN